MILISIDQLMNSAKSNYFPICICDSIERGLGGATESECAMCIFKFDVCFTRGLVADASPQPIAIIFIIPICSIVFMQVAAKLLARFVKRERIRLNCAYLFKIIVESMSLSVQVELARFSQCISVGVHMTRAHRALFEEIENENKKRCAAKCNVTTKNK